MSKHTSGPWFVSPTGQYVREQGIHGPNICDTNVSGAPLEECVANARLIAAAPDLLAACQRLAAAYVQLWQDATDEEYGECTDSELVAARAAIAKATGEKP